MFQDKDTDAHECGDGERPFQRSSRQPWWRHLRWGEASWPSGMHGWKALQPSCLPRIEREGAECGSMNLGLHAVHLFTHSWIFLTPSCPSPGGVKRSQQLHSSGAHSAEGAAPPPLLRLEARAEAATERASRPVLRFLWHQPWPPVWLCGVGNAFSDFLACCETLVNSCHKKRKKYNHLKSNLRNISHFPILLVYIT